MRRSAKVLIFSFAVVGCEAETASRTATGGWEVRATAFSVGGTDAREDYQLFKVVAATRLSDGRIAIANSGTSQIRYYSADGSYLGASGRVGDGPGEFRYIFEVTRLRGDSLLITARDPGFTWLDERGEFVRSERLSLIGVPLSCRISESSFTTLADGTQIRLYHDNLYGPQCPAAPANPWQETALIAHVDRLAGTLDSIATIPGTERNSPNYRVYGKIPLIAAGADAVYAMESGSPEILKLSFMGDTLRLLPTPFTARRIPDSAKTQAVREFQRDGQTVEGNPYLYPEFFPAVGRIVLARDGSLWVMAYPDVAEPIASVQVTYPSGAALDPRGALWRALDDDGTVLGEVRTPPGFYPLEIGRDYMLGVTLDEDDLETVVMYEIIR